LVFVFLQKEIDKKHKQRYYFFKERLIMKENTYISTGVGKASERMLALIKNISKKVLDERVLKAALLVLLIAGGVAKAGAEEVTGTILFVPKETWYGYQYLLATGKNRIADKMTQMSYKSVGNAIDVLPYYLVRGAKIVYENKGMKNEVGEYVHPERIIGIITKEEEEFIELTELLTPGNIAYNFPYLDEKLVREGRAR
jgi:uncharacterized protein (DUF342 family)